MSLISPDSLADTVIHVPSCILGSNEHTFKVDNFNKEEQI
jgi:hypothetical protein